MLSRGKSDIGLMDRRVTIEQLTTVADEYNQKIPTWATFRVVWAEMMDRSGSESYQADQLTASRNTVWRIRFISSLNETMRIRYQGRVYNIEAIKRLDRKMYMDVVTTLQDDPVLSDETVSGGAFSSAYSSAYDR